MCQCALTRTSNCSTHKLEFSRVKRVPGPCSGLSFLVLISSVVLCRIRPQLQCRPPLMKRNVHIFQRVREGGEGRTWRNKGIKTLWMSLGKAKVSFGSRFVKMWKGTYSGIFVSAPTLTSPSSFSDIPSMIRSPDPVSLKVEKYVKLFDCMVLSFVCVCVCVCTRAHARA